MDSFYTGSYGVACIERRSKKDRRVSSGYIPCDSEKRGCGDRRSGIPRRKKRRFGVCNFTYVKLCCEHDKDIGQLLDISTEGLSFRYLSNGEGTKTFSELSILLSNGDLAVSSVPIKTTSDVDLHPGASPCPINFRRAGVQFGFLTDIQKNELDRYLDTHILGKTSSAT